MDGTLAKSEVTRSEAQRLETLDRYQIADAAPDPAIDDLAELTAKICNAPVAGVAFATAEHICIHGRYGIREIELPAGQPALRAALSQPERLRDSRYPQAS